MNLLGLVPQTYANLILFLLMLIRIAFLFSTFILFRRDYVNARIIIAFSSILAFYALLITHNKSPKYELFSLLMIYDVFFQIFIGFLCGFILNIIFEIFTAVGQIISSQVGFTMVTLFDPRFGMITPLTLFYNYFSIIIFFLLNGHLITIKLILDSFITIPINTFYSPLYRMNEIIHFAGNIFVLSVSLSITIIISMLITNITIAVMSRFAPQFNIFSVGVNFTIIFGLIFVYLTFGFLINNGEQVMQNGMIFLTHILSGMK